MKKIIFISLFTLCLTNLTWAQRYPERREVRKGNKSYNEGDLQSADLAYRTVLSKDSTIYQAAFNLGDVLYRQENLDAATKSFKSLAEDSVRLEHADKANYNLGNVYFQQKKYEEALEAYKQSLRLNPNDEEARFNLAYTQKMLQNEQEQQQNQDNQDQNEDNQDQQQNQDNQNQDQQQNQNEQNQNQNQDQKEQEQQQQQAQAQISQQEAERMLEAMQMNEDKTREKVQEEKAKGVVQSGKNW